MTAATVSPTGVVGLTAIAVGLLLAPAAAAHIDMIQPPPREVGSSREPNSDLKQGPCGQIANGRTSRVSVFEPGETIEVTWRETINHRSYYRVAFDRDGDDAFPTFAGPGRGAQDVDPRDLCPVDGQVILAYELEDGQRETRTLRVTLPEVECERCTLQVVQYMFDANNPYYFQCADLALRRRDADAGAGGDALLDASLPDAAVEPPRAASTCSSRIAPLDAGSGTPRRGDDDREPAPSPQTPAAAPERDEPSAAPALESAADQPPPRGSSGCALARLEVSNVRASTWLLLSATVAACLRLRRSRRDPAERPCRGDGRCGGHSAELLNAGRIGTAPDIAG
jgi:hypothetical protein